MATASGPDIFNSTIKELKKAVEARPPGGSLFRIEGELWRRLRAIRLGIEVQEFASQHGEPASALTEERFRELEQGPVARARMEGLSRDHVLAGFLLDPQRSQSIKNILDGGVDARAKDMERLEQEYSEYIKNAGAPEDWAKQWRG